MADLTAEVARYLELRHPGLIRPAASEQGGKEKDRWPGLRRARDPVPAAFGGQYGMRSWSRGLGQTVETALRAAPGAPWWFDPELPLDRIDGGLPRWDPRTGKRAGGPSAEDMPEFGAVVSEYVRAFRHGGVFPPVLVMAVQPAELVSEIGILPAVSLASLTLERLGIASTVRAMGDCSYSILNLSSAVNRLPRSWSGGNVQVSLVRPGQIRRSS